jgi:hypothetical protein
LERLERRAGQGVSGFKADGGGLFFCGGGNSGKVRVVRRPKRTWQPFTSMGWLFRTARNAVNDSNFFTAKRRRFHHARQSAHSFIVASVVMAHWAGQSRHLAHQ